MARGLGAFAEGFAQGYGQMSEIEARQAAMERDKERLALERNRADMEKERFGLEKQQAELGMQKTTMDIAAAKREEDFQADLRKNLTELDAERQAGYEGEIINTRTGKSEGFKRFQNPDQEIGAMKERGLAFKPGTIKQVGEMDPIEYQLKFADRFMAAHARAGKLDPKMLADARAQRKQIESEGALEALRYFMTTGDEKGAKQKFNKQGKISIGDDIKLSIERDPIVGPKVIGMRGNQKVFDAFDDVILPSMSPEAWAKTQADIRKVGIEQSQENLRTDKRVRGGIEEALIRERSGGSGGDKMIDRMTKEINDQFSLIEAGLKLSTNVVNSAPYIQRKLKAVALARDYLANGVAKSVAQAASMGWEDSGAAQAPARTAVPPPR